MLVMIMAGGVAMQAVVLALLAAGLPVVRAVDLPMALRIVARVPVGLIVTGGGGGGLAPVCERCGAPVIVVGGGCDPGLVPYLLAAVPETGLPELVVELARVWSPSEQVRTVKVEPVQMDPVQDAEGIPDWADLVAELRAAVAQGCPRPQVAAEADGLEEWEPGDPASEAALMQPVASPLVVSAQVRRFAIVA